MTLADLWIFFEHGSLFGAPVHTAGSALGPSTAYFVPLLSAMRLFAVGEPESTQDHPSCGNSVDQHRCEAQYWRRRACLSRSAPFAPVRICALVRVAAPMDRHK